MKSVTSFRLSDETIEQLNTLAARYKKSQAEVLEFMIADRYSVSDDKKNRNRRKAKWVEFRETHKDRINQIMREYIFIAGYNNGWVDFQTRHCDNDFVIKPPED